MEILYTDPRVIAVRKEAGIPTQPDPTGDTDLMSALKEALRQRGESSELYLIHRLDRIVGGALVFARTKGEAAALSRAVAEGKVCKEYLAVVDGETPNEGIFSDYLIKDARTNRAHCVPKERKGAKYAELSFRTLKQVKEGERTLSLVHIVLKTGRFHQIRIQFSDRALPLLGDGKYGSRENRTRCALFAYRLTFPHDGRNVTVSTLPQNKFPWDLFSETICNMEG